MKDRCIVNVGMERELKEQIQAIADRELRSLSGQIRQFIKRGIRADEAQSAVDEEERAP